MTHGKPERIGPALARLESVARDAGVELVDADDTGDIDLVVVLGGDGTMLRALARFLEPAVPVIGVNFGRVGFLSSIPRGDLEAGLLRAFSGEFEVYELPTVAISGGDGSWVAVNDLVLTSGVLGRMVELEWAVGGERLGTVPCDGVVCAAPSGSTAYNLSNGGPVLVWGLDAMAVTFVSPHSLHARPLVVPRDTDVIMWNRTPDVPVVALVDGHRVTELGPGGRVVARLDAQRSLLATLPEVTFFSRYSRTFAS